MKITNKPSIEFEIIDSKERKIRREKRSTLGNLVMSIAIATATLNIAVESLKQSGVLDGKSMDS